VNVTAVPAQIVEVPLIEIVGVTGATTVVVIAFDVAGLPITPLRLDVIIHVTTAPDGSEVAVYVGLFVPTFAPFTCHWYVGVVPPLIGFAVNVTLVPVQIILSASLEVMETFAVVVDANWKE